jgi:hypothetical protein
LGQIGRRFRSGAVHPLGSLRSKFLFRAGGNIAAWGFFILVAGSAGQPSNYLDGVTSKCPAGYRQIAPDSPDCTDVFFAEYVFIDLLRFAQTAVATLFFVQ